VRGLEDTGVVEEGVGILLHGDVAHQHTDGQTDGAQCDGDQPLLDSQRRCLDKLTTQLDQEDLRAEGESTYH